MSTIMSWRTLYFLSLAVGIIGEDSPVQNENYFSYPIHMRIDLIGESANAINPLLLEMLKQDSLLLPGLKRSRDPSSPDIFPQISYSISTSTPKNEDSHWFVTTSMIVDRLNEEFPLNSSIFDLHAVYVLPNNDFKERVIAMGKSCSRSVLANVAFFDFASKFCELSADASMMDWVQWNSLVKSGNAFLKLTDRQKAIQLFTVTMSLLEALLPVGFRRTVGSTSDKIYVPVVSFFNGPLSEDEKQKQEMDQDEVTFMRTALLPSQEFRVMHTQHFIDEHPRVTTAVTSSTRHRVSKLPIDSDQSEGVQRILSGYYDVPYVDSNLFHRQLSDVGDHFVNRLLSNAGFDEELFSELKQREGSALLEELFSGYSGSRVDETNERRSADDDVAIDVGSKEDLSTTFGWRWFSPVKSNMKRKVTKSTTSILPVFVLSDLHLHLNRLQPNSQASLHSTDPVYQLPVQPLFEDDSWYAIFDDVVLVLHSTGDEVATFDQSENRWRPTKAPDLNLLVQSALTTALTGIVAPHKRNVNVWDTIWANGNHPFLPFGRHQRYEDGQSSLLGIAARRRLVLTRVYTALERMQSISKRSSLLVQQAVDAILVLDGLSVPRIPDEGLELGTNNSESDSNSHPVGLFSTQSSTLKRLPSHLIDTMVSIEDRLAHLQQHLNEVQIAANEENSLDQILDQISRWEKSLDSAEVNFVKTATLFQEDLAKCRVRFEKDPAVSQREANPQGPVKTFSAALWSAVSKTKKRFGLFLVVLGVVTLGFIGLALKIALNVAENRAKKLK